jgi:hypothetical protein
MLYTSPWLRFEFTTSVGIGTDCIGSWKSNYHTITAMTDQRELHVNKNWRPQYNSIIVEWGVKPHQKKKNEQTMQLS